MKDLTLKTYQASNAFAACELIGENEIIQGDAVQKISLIREYCLPAVRAFEKGRNQLAKQCQMIITVDGRVMPTQVFSKAEPEVQDRYREKWEEGLEKLNESTLTISMPDLKSNDFYLAEDRDFDLLDKDGKLFRRSMKKGDPMVPAKFFMLMNPLFNPAEGTAVEKKKK